MNAFLTQPLLARTSLDRCAHRRADDALLPALMNSPETGVVLVHEGRVPVADAAAGVALITVPPVGLPEGQLAYLGRGTGGAGSAAVASGDGEERELVMLQLDQPYELGPQTHWSGLRELGAIVSAADAGLITCSIALANWHTTHPRCARCGELTHSIQSGWARRCSACSAEHYPRTDPAVIMSIIDDDDRILLGRQQVWPAGRYSTLAGFVEAGESAEAAVIREAREESGLIVAQPQYLGSQPWPFPASLMLAFTARCTGGELAPDGEELADARWWSREELAADVASGSLLLPPGISIARHLIEAWYGASLADAPDSWR